MEVVSKTIFQALTHGRKAERLNVRLPWLQARTSHKHLSVYIGGVEGSGGDSPQLCCQKRHSGQEQTNTLQAEENVGDHIGWYVHTASHSFSLSSSLEGTTACTGEDRESSVPDLSPPPAKKRRTVRHPRHRRTK